MANPVTTTDYKLQLHTILDDSMHFQAVEAAFFGFIKHNEDEENNKKDLFLQTFKEFWTNLSEDDNNQAIVNFVEYSNTQHTQVRTSYLYELLQSLVEGGYIPAKKACETILHSPYLKFDNAKVWRASFSFVNHFIHRMDYKSVRAVFTVLLTLARDELPETFMRSQEHLLNDVKQILLVGMDRSSGLLPSYFVVNEMYKLYPVDNYHPHWALAKEFTKFLDSFKPLAQMVSITGLSWLRPVVGCTGTSNNMWTLEPNTLKFPLKGPLPYSRELIGPQKKLLQYVISQPSSKDIVCSMLGLKKQQKQRCEALEELLVDQIVLAMERTETHADGDESYLLLWQLLSSQLIFFVLFQFASFPHIVTALHEKLSTRKLTKGRGSLMWVLLQFISGSVQKKPLVDFLPVMKLFNTLYSSDKETLPVPDVISASTIDQFSMACIWTHLAKKAQDEKINMQRGPPKELLKQLSFLQETLQKKQMGNQNFEIALLCNAYSTSPDSFAQPNRELIDVCCGVNQPPIQLPGPTPVLAQGAIVPINMRLLDCLTVHAKMSLIHGIVTRILRLATEKQGLALAPALIETYSRLLVYTEIEMLGIKSFVNQMLPKVCDCEAWGILHTLLEMFSFRLLHIPATYRVTLLHNLHNLATVPFTDNNQLHACVQNTSLRLITGFGSSDIQLQLSNARLPPKVLLSKDCEELNKTLVLTIARAMRITGSDSMPLAWSESVLKEAFAITPHGWSSATLQCFPKVMQQFYNQHPVTREPGKTLFSRVEKHYKKLKNISSDDERLGYCTSGDQNVVDISLCLIWKIAQEHASVTAFCYHLLMRTGPRALSNHLRTFADYLVYEFRMHGTDPNVSKRFQLLNELVWRYGVFPLDRLILTLALRNHDDKDAHVCFYIVKVLLLNYTEMKIRVQKFVSENNPQHWVQTDWHDKHIAFHKQFPEYFYYEGIIEANQLKVPPQEYFPTYFGNICLRFIPVLDIVIHRLLELPPAVGSSVLDMLFKEYGSLYKFHDRPITYLYNTLHYYEPILRDNFYLKKKLVAMIVNAQQDMHSPGWLCTDELFEYVNGRNDNWLPDHTYFIKILSRFINEMENVAGAGPWSGCDWRFNEHPNAAAHALHVTCVELMALPVPGPQVANTLVDLVCVNSKDASKLTIRRNIMGWINAIGLIISSLPNTYLQVLNDKLLLMVSSHLSQVTYTPLSPVPSFLDFQRAHSFNCELYLDYVLAIFHASWLHASSGQFAQLSTFLSEQVKPLVKNEAQLLYVFTLFGPFLHRFQLERTRPLFDVCSEFYYILEQVCQNTTCLVFVDVISDFLYHVKYRFVGDNLRDVIEKTLGSFHEALRFRLKFLAAHPPKREENPSSVSAAQFDYS